MPPVLIAGGNKLAREIRVEHAVQLDAEMMADPFRVKFCVVGDL